jgi:transcriptional regulator with XRE-family HTH domain
MTMSAARAGGRGRSYVQDTDRHVGRRIRERRVMLGLSKHQLAKMVGIAYQQAHKYEKGVNRIAAGRLHAIARALGVEPAYFYEGLGSGEPPRATARQRQVIDLARSFAALPRPQQEAIARLARALTGKEAAAV